MPEYVNALRAEIELYSRFSAEETVETVYLGGGTPSVMRPAELERIFHALRSHFTIKPDAEITLEANPGTTLKEVLSGYHQIGINRLSIGIQSFNDHELKFLSRIHSAEDAYKTFRDAREAGFANIGIDLMYALPGQAIDGWHDTLEKGVALMPEHISAYNLTIEDKTPLGKQVLSGLISPLTDDEEALFFTHAMEFLRDKGYVHYEVSNYAKPGYESRHNRNYWNHAQYLGFGPSAHSFWGKKRWWNVPDTRKYIGFLLEGRLPAEDSEEISTKKLVDEMIMLGLRTGCLDIGGLGKEASDSIRKKARDYLDGLIAGGMIIIENDAIRLTDRGFLFCDEIAERLSSCV